MSINIRKCISLCIYCAMGIATAQAEDTIRLLCIGNSFSWDAVEQELVPLCNAAGQPIVVGNLYYGGCSLAQHHTFLCTDSNVYSFRYLTNDTTIRQDNYTLRQALKGYHWNYISFQQASHDSGITSTYEPYLTALIDSVRNYQPQASLCWMQTWSYAQNATHPAFPCYQSSQQVMDNAIRTATQYVLKQHPQLLLVPCGKAVRLARRRFGDTLCRDGYHLNYTYGRYLASCVWFVFLMEQDAHLNGRIPRKDIRLNHYCPQSMTDREKSISQRIARRVILQKFSAP